MEQEFVDEIAVSCTETTDTPLASIPNHLQEYVHVTNTTDQGKDLQDIESKICTLVASVFPQTNRLFPVWVQTRISLYCFLAILGFLTGAVSFTIDLLAGYCNILQFLMIQNISSWWLGLFLWTLFSVVLVAVAVVLTAYLNPHAVGGGVPQIKTIISGMPLPHSVNFKALIATIFGLILAIGGGGLFVGKEGPMIRISCAIAFLLFRAFPLIKNNDQLKTRLLVSAAACGMASNFSSIIGGIFFSIEVTSAYYSVRNFWLSGIACIFGALTFRLTTNLVNGNVIFTSTVATIYHDTLADFPFQLVDLLLAVLYGLIAGLAAALFTHMNYLIRILRQRFLCKIGGNYLAPLLYTLPIAFVTAILIYPRLVGDFMSLPAYSLLQDLFNSEQFGDEGHPPFLGKDWADRDPIANLFILFIVRSIITEFSITAMVPAGLYIPSLIVGGALGRIVAESLLHVATLNPGGYAVVGATAFAAAFTQTFSSIPILIDITGQVLFFLPMTIATAISLTVSRIIGYLVRTPFLRHTRCEEYSHGLTAKDVLDSDFIFLTPTVSVADLGDILALYPQLTFPIVNNQKELKFLGTVERDTLIHLLEDQLNPTNLRLPCFSLSKILQVIRENFSYARDIKTHILRQEKLFNTARKAERTREVHILYELPEVSVIKTTPFDDLHILFTFLRWRCAFVVEDGTLIGWISRERLSTAEQGIHRGLQIKGMYLD